MKPSESQQLKNTYGCVKIAGCGMYAMITLITLGAILTNVAFATDDGPLTAEDVRLMLNSSGSNYTKVYSGDEIEANNGIVSIMCQRGSAKYIAGFELANGMAPIYAREVFKILFRDPRVLRVRWSVYSWQDDGINPRSKVWGKTYEADKAYADQVEDWDKVNMGDLRVSS
jgi:hypothetical protein